MSGGVGGLFLGNNPETPNPARLNPELWTVRVKILSFGMKVSNCWDVRPGQRSFSYWGRLI